MGLFNGIRYNLRGLKLGLKTPRLLVLGLLRFVLLMVVTVVAAVLIISHYQNIMGMMWTRPESAWLAWLWYVCAWLLALLLTGISAVVGFFISQILFSVLIMDHMSQITERLVSGQVSAPPGMPWYSYFFNLLRQEIPRALLPVLISLVLLVLGWLTPLGPVLTFVSPLAAATFLAWDNTDLMPARRLEPFGRRFKMLRNNLGFHIGFGLWFLVPVLNILSLSFAPVGGTLFCLEQIAGVSPESGPSS